IPLYNSRDFIFEAIESVLRQTYSNIEVIVFDDASTDGSYNAVVRKYSHDGRIRIFQNSTNLGASRTRLLGCNEATGDYISFLDSDDYLAPQFLEIMLHIFNATNSDLVFSNFKHFNILSEIMDDRFSLKGKPISRIEYINSLSSGKVIGSCCMRMYPKEIVKNVEPVDRLFSRGEDLVFNLDIINDIHNIYYVDLPL
ncbi:glycosyltransferase family 2 protein, partial [Vibrio jasicida]|uniref:glycosyltransferase family 2 protein n=1 Tax=Vibrio jasicida TaxID=766224 RepID=UPI0011B0E9A6